MTTSGSVPGNDRSGSDAAPEAVRQLNSLLRGEISALETYRMAVEKVSGADPLTADRLSILRGIQSEHGQAAEHLRACIRRMGGEPSDSSGA